MTVAAAPNKKTTAIPKNKSFSSTTVANIFSSSPLSFRAASIIRIGSPARL